MQDKYGWYGGCGDRSGRYADHMIVYLEKRGSNRSMKRDSYLWQFLHGISLICLCKTNRLIGMCVPGVEQQKRSERNCV